MHWCVTVDYQQVANDNIANQIHGFTIDYGKFILKLDSAKNSDYEPIVGVLRHMENSAPSLKIFGFPDAL